MILTTAVLIPGNMCDLRLWGGGGDLLPRQLAARGFAVVEADTRSDATIAEMASRLLHDTAGPIVAIGFSMGGIVALEAVRQAPRRITGLVLADSSCTADRPERASARPGQQARVRRGLLRTVVTDELAPNYLAADNRTDAGLNALILDMALSLGPDVFVRQSEALRTRECRATVIDTFPGPLLLVAGAEDALCPPAGHAAMAARARRPMLQIIPGAGHITPLEQPAAFAAAVIDWFDANPELLPCVS